MNPNPLLVELGSIAESQIGTQEDAKHQNAGSAILKYQRATNLDGQGWPWCAAFVDWCIAQLFINHPELSRNFSRPQTAAAFGLIDWARAHGFHIFGPRLDHAERGDIVVYTFSHTGIVASADDYGFCAIEGNSNTDGSRDGYEVVRHARAYTSVNRFIRLPV